MLKCNTLYIANIWVGFVCKKKKYIYIYKRYTCIICHFIIIYNGSKSQVRIRCFESRNQQLCDPHSLLIIIPPVKTQLLHGYPTEWSLHLVRYHCVVIMVTAETFLIEDSAALMTGNMTQTVTVAYFFYIRDSVKE